MTPPVPEHPDRSPSFGGPSNPALPLVGDLRHSHGGQHSAQTRSNLLNGIRAFVVDYFWLMLKNVIGWTFILGSPVLGIALPGPGGIPVFLIGFALVTFPGKRRLTSRVIRGVPIRVEPVFFVFLVTLISILITAGLLWLAQHKYEHLLRANDVRINLAELLGVCALAAGVTWFVMRLVLTSTNFVIRRVPLLRQKVRPWLRRKGINLLPPRRRRGQQPGVTHDRPPDEIVEFDAKYSRGLIGMWGVLKIWFRRLFALGITGLIFWFILKPIHRNWHDPNVQQRLNQLNVIEFFVASAMFAMFLFAFRAMAWRRILSRLGHTLPVMAATRIWSTSELARYLPGAIFQVVGRVYLIKPYGVRGSVTSVSQILELTVFLLANVLLAVLCLAYLGVKNMTGAARVWMAVAMALVPVLLGLLHPKVTYGLINAVMRRLGKPDIASPLSGPQMLGILGWNMVGLVWQSQAVFLLTHDVLGLNKPQWWWIVAGAYSLAWCAGFLAVWAPGGIGVRELVFVAAMSVALPPTVQEQLGNREQAAVVLGFLSLLLRLWATVGELMLAAVAYALDLRGALGRPDAPGIIARGIR